MIHKTRTKALSLLLTLAMVVGLMPGMGLTAYAATDTYTNLIPTGSETNVTGKSVLLDFAEYPYWYVRDHPKNCVNLQCGVE